MDTGLAIAAVGAVLSFYFIPSCIAVIRACKHGGSIFLINLLFGWTVLGWFAALIWAIVEAPEAVQGASGSAAPPLTTQEDLPKAKSVREAIIEQADRMHH